MLSAWIQTLFSFRSYRRIASASTGKLMLFIVYLLCMGALVFNIYFSSQIHKQLTPFLASLPEITFQKGTLIEPKNPVTISLPSTNLAIRLAASDATPLSQEYFLRENLLAQINGNRLYMPSIVGVQSQLLPPQLDLTLNPQTWQKYGPILRNMLQTAAFLGSFVMLSSFLLFSTLLAASILFLWRELTRADLPARVLWHLAILLQGPAVMLWLINLFLDVPLFLFALFILFNMYTQQILNTLQER